MAFCLRSRQLCFEIRSELFPNTSPFESFSHPAKSPKRKGMQPSSKKNYSKDMPYLGISLLLLFVALLRLGTSSSNGRNSPPSTPPTPSRSPAQLSGDSNTPETGRAGGGHQVFRIICQNNSFHAESSKNSEISNLSQVRIEPCPQMSNFQLTRVNTNEKFLLLSKNNALLTPIFSKGNEDEVFQLNWTNKKTKKAHSEPFQWKKINI